MPLLETKGAASAQGFGEFARTTAAVYIEDVFSCFLYTGNGSTQTITNNIDLSGKGGLVWIKRRDVSSDHRFTDTLRGTTNVLSSNNTSGQVTDTNGLTSFGSTGFTVGSDSGYNLNASTYVSWTFREQAKFFDVVTFTTNGSKPPNTSNISHNLGSTPGCVIVKRTSGSQDWKVYHRSLSTPTNKYFELNSTSTVIDAGTAWISVSSTNISFPGSILDISSDYVAYLFAHDAGGFGTAGSDNVISCGSFTTDGSGNATVNLGYEPQWLMVKASNYAQSWYIEDNMRAFNLTSRAILFPNFANAEATGATAYLAPNSTGFAAINGQLNASTTYIYIAIRRGPMKTPTSGTSVYTPIARSGNGTATTVTGVGFPPDLVFLAPRTATGANNWIWFDRLRGGAVGLSSDNTGAEFTNSAVIQSDSLSTTMDGFRVQTANPINASGQTYINYPLRRAPGFFDVVCYTGTGSATTVSHNLGVAPELLIVKKRSGSAVNWVVWASAPTPQENQYNLNLNTAGSWGSAGDKNWGATASGTPNMTSTTFSLGDYVGVNNSSDTYVAYLFASVSGVSKVGSYTGTGALQTVNCGFSGGARFVLIKRTDSTGDWWVYDSARGISSGNDPYLYLNSIAAEVTGTNYVDTTSVGFQVTAAAPAGLNASGGTYIFLAIA